MSFAITADMDDTQTFAPIDAAHHPERIPLGLYMLDGELVEVVGPHVGPRPIVEGRLGFTPFAGVTIRRGKRGPIALHDDPKPTAHVAGTTLTPYLPEA